MNNPWRDRFWEIFHILKAEEVFIDQVLMMVDADSSMNFKRRYDKYIITKQEERQKLRNKIDELVLGLPQGE
jgi:hypothetical protein